MQRSQIVRFALASGSVRVTGIAAHLFARQEYMQDKTYIPEYTTNMSKQPRNKLQQVLLKLQLRE